MESSSQLDWQSIRARAASFPEEAFHFVREALQHVAKTAPDSGAAGACESHRRAADADLPESRRHITGQELCVGLRELAIQRYGLLAQSVLQHWGIRRTEDFGLLVYAMIDRQELRASADDSPADFAGIYDFDEAFPKSLVD